MNRSLVIPAVGCLIAFAALSAVLHGTLGQESAAEPHESAATMPSIAFNRGDGLSIEEAEAVLTSLADEHVRPWRRWENSPQRLYSRAAVRPIPSIVVQVTMSSTATTERDPFHLATITITTGEASQSVPCVVDRSTKQVRLFADGQWLTAEQWVEKGPLPSQLRKRADG